MTLETQPQHPGGERPARSRADLEDRPQQEPEPDQTSAQARARSTGVPAGAAWTILVAAALGLLLLPDPVSAYIGPGAGFAVAVSFLVLVSAVLLGGVIVLTWPLRLLVGWRRRRRCCDKSSADRVIILGFDGLDPEIAEDLMAGGRLPNLSRLRERGSYSRLATTCPPMSPVAWSSFMTGAGPGSHGIFDFLRRDPRTYLPDLSSAQIDLSRRVLRLGRVQLSVGRPSLRSLRAGKTFWAVLGEHGIFSTILRVPITFPPERFKGLLLSGMCVPDLRGGQGSFTFFSTARGAAGSEGEGQRVTLRQENGVFHGALPGPPRPGAPEEEPAEARFGLRPNGDGSATLEIAGEKIVLRQGEYSSWVPITFRLAPGQRASGICRFYLKRVRPQVELYASPINIDPERPALPVSHPVAYSIYLAKKLGRFATLGLAEDTSALNEGVLDDSAFLKQCQLFGEERESMLFNALENSRQGCIVCVFDETDRVQHMFWPRREESAPAASEELPACRHRAIAAAYERADLVVGKTLQRLRERDVLLVMSDHGFKPFRRGVNLNSWLRENEYLRLRRGATGEAAWLGDVDWGGTRAYALGLSGLYLNLEGREAGGIVSRAEARSLKEQLAEKLTGLRDEETGAIAIERVFETTAVNPGPHSDRGPDLIIGYAPGYRASWDGAKGKMSRPVFEDNTRRWSGDHCVDPRHVPGVLFSSRGLKAPSRIIDLAPTVLDLFGISTPACMEGRSLLAGDEGEGCSDG